MSPWLWLLLFLDDSACFHERSKENYPWPCWSSHCDGWWDIFCTYGRRTIYFSTVYQFVSEVLDSAASSLLMHLVFTCTIEPGLSPSVLLLLVICDMETGISLIWVFLAFVLFAMFVCVKDTRFISLGMGVVGLRAASLCTIWQEPIFVGSSNHNPFAASLSHAWQAWSISRDHRQGFRIQKDDQKKSSGEQNIYLWNGMSGTRMTFTGKFFVLHWLASTAVVTCMLCFVSCRKQVDPRMHENPEHWKSGTFFTSSDNISW